MGERWGIEYGTCLGDRRGTVPGAVTAVIREPCGIYQDENPWQRPSLANIQRFWSAPQYGTGRAVPSDRQVEIPGLASRESLLLCPYGNAARFGDNHGAGR